MQLKELLRSVGTLKKVTGSSEMDISGIAYDSRRVAAGDIFVAIHGFSTDGNRFVDDAITRGAPAVLVEESHHRQLPVTTVVVDNARLALAEVAAAFYGHPSRRLKVLGVTGTNGKTTVTYLLESILKTAGHRVGLIGTVESRFGGETVPSALTTPESLELEQYLKRMVEEKVDFAVMEVSSHALALERVAAVEFDRAIFTNLTRDHLDFHQNMNEYQDAKLRLFKGLSQSGKKDARGIINLDDPAGELFTKAAGGQVTTYAVHRPADFTAEEVEYKLGGTDFTLIGPTGKFPVSTPLVGEFNLYNALAAMATAQTFAISPAAITEALRSFPGAPGRFERIDVGQKFPVIVDFAHSPDSLSKLLATVRQFISGRLILVFGCTGDRDREKRPQMGEIAAALADYSVISTDDPHDEDPRKIIEEVARGFSGKKEGEDYQKISDRREAIECAILMAKPEDAVVIAGRGHEQYQDFAGKKIMIDDRQVAREALKKCV